MRPSPIEDEQKKNYRWREKRRDPKKEEVGYVYSLLSHYYRTQYCFFFLWENCYIKKKPNLFLFLIIFLTFVN